MNRKLSHKILKAHKKEYDRKFREARFLKGLCTRCGGERDTWHIYCSKCNEYLKNRRKLSYNKKKNNKQVKQYQSRNRIKGKCPYCGGRLDDIKYKSCKKCRAKALKKYYKNRLKIKIRSIREGRYGYKKRNI
jgi:hypothetical protein